ncbi:hypothetical protein BHE74_00020171, partial [Ensete ventricosum]
MKTTSTVLGEQQLRFLRPPKFRVPTSAVSRQRAATESVLATAAAITDQRQKIEQYKLILASVLSSSPTDVTQAKRFIDHSTLPLPSRSGFSSSRPVSVVFDRLFLPALDDDAVNAEAFINKASFLVNNSQHEVPNLQYKVIMLWTASSFEELGALLGIPPQK